MNVRSLKRACAGLLAVIMLLTAVPLPAFAQDTDTAVTEPTAAVTEPLETVAETEAAETMAVETEAPTAETTGPDSDSGVLVFETLASDSEAAADSTDSTVSADAVSAEELEAALTSGAQAICITADFALDRTFYITHDVTIYTTEAHTLTRAADFAGDIFVVGEAADGTACAEKVTLTLGDPASNASGLLVIDGNSENMTVDVVGTVLFLCASGRADLYENLTITNCAKAGNERTLNETHSLSYRDQIGGAAAILAGSSAMNIYGGTYSANSAVVTDKDSHGGAFYNYGTLKIYGGLFEGNSAARAGAFYNYRTMYIYNAEIKNNSASTMGGAIYMPASTVAFLYIGEDNDVVESNVLFSGNTAQTNGGAIYGQNQFSVKNAVFSGNTAQGVGGAIYTNATASIADSTFENNSAVTTGGAIHQANTLSVTDCVFSGNTSASGGSVYVSKGTFTLDGSTLTGNSANIAGAVYLEKALATVTDTVFTSNESTGTHGGAIACYGQNDAAENVDLMMIGVRFTGNTANYNGGGLYISGSRVYMRDAEFTSNTAKATDSSYGGAAIYSTNSQLEINYAAFNQNTSDEQGGAISLYTSSVAVLNEVTATGNTASGYGGFAYVNKSQLDMYNSTLRSNTAATGGAIDFRTSATGSLYNCVFHANTSTGASSGGGAVSMYTEGTGTLIHSCTFTNNTATNFGGGVYISGVSTLELYNITGTGNSAAYGGFMYETKAGTEVTISGLSVFGNTDTKGGPIIWGNTFNAVLNINKNNYSDLDATGALDDAYWAAAIYNKLTVNDVDTQVPEYTDYLPPAFDPEAPNTPVPDPVLPPAVGSADVYSAQELEDALAGELSPIRIMADFEIDRTFYVTRNVTIYSVDAHTLTRAADFTGDIFAMGKTADGTLCGSTVVLTLGEETSAEKDRLVIDGNRSNMTQDVTGSVLDLCGSANVNIHENVTITNCATTGDGAVAALSGSSVLNVYGGTFSGNSAVNGGAVSNASVVNIYGGTWSANTAVSGGVLYNTGSLHILGGVFADNEATQGGAVYTTGKLVTSGGSFEGNTAENGGAVSVSGGTAVISDTVFTGNEAVRNGGGLCLADSASLTMTGSRLDSNRATYGGAVYSSASSCDIRSTDFIHNISDYYGGAIALYASSTAVLSGITAEGNTAVYSGGFLYSIGSELTITGSEIRDSSSDRAGGALSLNTGAVTNISSTTFAGNTAATNGGVMYVCTGAAQTQLNGCTFTGNTAGQNGGVLCVAGGSLLSAYDTVATGNSAEKGSVVYETGTGTTVTIDGITVSGNTATSGFLVYGGSASAILNINKTTYTDADATSSLDDAYWASAIANKLTVSEITEPIPDQPDDGEQDNSTIEDALAVYSAAELEAAVNANTKYIRIAQDFTLDRTFYITSDVTIFTTEQHILTRSPNFAGDIFVVGEDAAGSSTLTTSGNARLTLGDPGSTKQDLLVIDGNRDNMSVQVNGTILFMANSAQVDLYDNVTIRNAYKQGNERVLREVYSYSDSYRAGGAIAMVMSGSLNIYGGSYLNSRTSDYDSTAEVPNVNTYGGAIFNYSNVTIYGGTFSGNCGHNGGVIYNYRITRIYGGTFSGNEAHSSGGVLYCPSSPSGHVLIGSSDPGASQVLFENNTAQSSGGAVMSKSLSSLVIYGSAAFRNNQAVDSNGGAISVSSQLTIRNASFTGNSSGSKGGAIYICNETAGNVTRFAEITGCSFSENTAGRGGAVALYASTADLEEGAIATITDCSFTANTAALPEGSASAVQGGALYVCRKSTLTMSGSSFIGNTSDNEAGAIYIASESEVDISDTTFTANTASGNAGAISIHSAYLTVGNAIWEENTAAGNGAALYISYLSDSTINSSVTVANSEFNSNSSGSMGGAIYSTEHTVEKDKRVLTLRNTDFYANSAVTYGGAIALKAGSDAYMKEISFLENTTTKTSSYGGAIYAAESSFELDDAIFSRNTAGSGGAVSLANGASAVMHNVTAARNVATYSGGFGHNSESDLTVYSSDLKSNCATSGGAMYMAASAVTKVYDTVFDGNESGKNGGAVYVYTGGTETTLQNCTMANNTAANFGGGIYASSASVLNLYNTQARNNTALTGGWMYITVDQTTVTVNGLTVSGNSATSGPIIYGNASGAVLNINKTNYVDADVSGELEEAYWTDAIANVISVNEINTPIPSYAPYVGEKEQDTGTSTQKEPVSVNDVLSLGLSSSDADINETYAAFPKLDNSSNFMSRNVTAYDNILGGTVTVDTFVSYKNQPEGNGQVGVGLLIYQALLYKQAYPEEEVYIDISAYRFSTQSAVNINRNSRYFGYMRDLQDCEYDEYGFVRIAYLLVTAAKMGIHVTAIGQLDGYPRVSSALSLAKYFTYKRNDPCDPDYADGVIGDYLNFQFCYWTLDQKGGTDMMHTKMCAVSDYLDMNGVAHQNAVWTSSSNLDGILASGANANNNIQTSTIITNHAELYRVASNYLRLIADYCGQEEIFEFQDIVNTRSTEQIDLLLAGKGSQIPKDEQIVYIGGENDDVFELYFTPFGGGSNVWDTTYNPYCKYLQAMYDSEDYILFTWNVASYSSAFPLGQQIENTIISAFHDNKNVNNKIYVVTSPEYAEGFADLEEGVDIGYKSINQKAYGGIHNKDVQVSYVQDGQRYFVTLHNSLNFHSGSMAYQSNFVLVIKEKTCAEDSVFSTIASLTTTGDIAAHTYGEWQQTLAPTAATLGKEVRECTLCGHQESRYIDQTGTVVDPDPSDPSIPDDPDPSDPSVTNPFVDVAGTDYFYDPVLWAYSQGITAGQDATHFNPTGFCTRAQAVTFLWRAAGEPEPLSTASIFPDVQEGTYYYKAVLWAVEQGITNGFPDGTFCPDQTCTRGQIVTFLWRNADSPAPTSTANPFSDANTDDYYGKAMLWAVEQGITNGFPDGTFGPEQTCTRSQIVTFLYRALV